MSTTDEIEWVLELQGTVHRLGYALDKTPRVPFKRGGKTMYMRPFSVVFEWVLIPAPNPSKRWQWNISEVFLRGVVLDTSGHPTVTVQRKIWHARSDTVDPIPDWIQHMIDVVWPVDYNAR